MLYADTYKVEKYPIPDRENKAITRQMKQSMEYCMKFAQGIYAEYVKGGTYWTTDDLHRISRNRSYAYGRQDTEKYKDQMYGKTQGGEIVATSPQGRRKAYNNIDFTVMSPMPRIMDKIVGDLSELTDIVSVDPIDKYSSGLKESMKWGLYVDGKHRDLLMTLKAMAGIPQEEAGYVPDNVEELNLYEAEGGFMPSYASVMERLLKHTFEISNWEENTVDRVIHDLSAIGFSMVEDVYDEYAGKVKIEYRDPMYSGVQYTRQDSYTKPDYGFSVIEVKISTLKQKGLVKSEQEACALANKYASQLGNPATDDWNAENKISQTHYSNGYDNYVVPVFRVYWVDVENYEEVQHTNKFGTAKTYLKKDTTKIGKMDNVISTRRKMLYGCNWVIGSELCYDYGYVRHQPRDGMADPVLPFHAVKVIGAPIVDRLIPALDQYMMGWLKFQQGLSMASINGFSIEIGAISNISLGGKKVDPVDIIKMWRQTGILYRKDKNVMGKIASTARPIEPLAGGAGNVIQESMLLMNAALQIIEQATGINPVSMGGTPDPDAGKKVTEFAIAGTSSILKNIVKQANVLKSNVARNVCLRLQYVIRDEKKGSKGYSDVVNDTELELVRIAEGQDIKYGIRTHVRPTRDEIQSLYQTIDLSLKNGRDGKVGITEADAVRLRAMITSGQSLKRVAQLLAFANKKAQEESEARAMRAQEMNMQVTNQTMQMDMQKRQVDSELKIKEAQATEMAKLSHDALIMAYEKGDITFEMLTQMISGAPAPQQQQQPVNPATQEAPTPPIGAEDEPTNIPG